MKLHLVILLAALSQIGFAKLPADYESRTAKAKQEYIAEQVRQTKYAELKNFSDLGCKFLLKSAVSLLKLKSSVNYVSDEMAEGRVKPVHTFGVTGPAVFIPSDAWRQPGPSFTGILAPGSAPTPLFVRLSLAAPAFAGYVPGLAIKFFLDGAPSINVHAIKSPTPRKDHNFFADPLSHIIPGPRGLAQHVLNFLFTRVVRDATRLRIDRLSTTNHDGSPIENPVVADHLIFDPTDSAASYTPANSKRDFREDLADIVPGTSLYIVRAKQKNGEIPVVGTIVTTGELIASEYGDKDLFFRHESETARYENDDGLSPGAQVAQPLAGGPVDAGELTGDQRP